MRVAPLVLLTLALVAGPALAQDGADAIDVVLTVPAEGAPTQQGGEAVLSLVQDSADRVAWRIDFVGENVAIELRIARTFGVAGAEQIVPLLELDANESRCIDVRAKDACDDATFTRFPNPRVWEGGDVARAYHRNGTLGDLVLRLNVPGPANGTLALEPDTTPPNLTVGEPTAINHYGFQLETRTDELAIVDVQVRKVGAEEWVRNPTPEPNLLQRFPVQGLDADTEYEYRAVASDWSGNDATSEIRRMRTAAAPVVPIPIVTILSPEPNATLQASVVPVVVRARVESPGSPVPPGGVQVFFDKKPVTEGIAFDGTDLTYTPREVIAAGHHTVSVEATNAAGGKGVARSRFDVEAPRDAPGATLALVLVGTGIALATKRAKGA